ncbi:MAG: anionic cell wall polymer biosynthesis LytR-Cps2A-Psr (LCP) family protein [Clostridium sp.]|jgi:anionic cell wall polymer biosynthesis LytR-Cps2A-Psr (LCP) family protein
MKIPFVNTVDTIGAVTIDVKQDEIVQTNVKINEVSKIEKKSVVQITKSGPQTLNGLQAVAYSRVRYTDGGDSRRTERQRTLLSELFTKIQSLGVTKFPAVVSELLPFTETSMNGKKIIKLGTKVFTSNIITLDQERFPVDGYCTGKMMGGMWYLVADIKATVDQLHKYIYEDIKPLPKAPLF